MAAKEPETVSPKCAQSEISGTDAGAYPASRSRTLQLGQWIVKGLLSVVILAGFIFLGQQISLLYEPPPTGALASQTLTSFDTKQPVVVQFGDASHAISQQEILGNPFTATDNLRKICHAAAKRSSFPQDEPSDAERTLLHSLLLGETTGDTYGVTVCAIESGSPIFIGIRHPLQETTNADPSDIARIVAWGFATQTQANRWKLRVVSYASPAENATEQSFVIALPPDSQRLLQMSSPDGDSVLAFTSACDLDQQIVFFNRFFKNNHWEQHRVWRTSGRTGQGVYTRIQGSRSETAHIHLHRELPSPEGEGQDQWRGIINLAYQSQQPR